MIDIGSNFYRPSLWIDIVSRTPRLRRQGQKILHPLSPSRDLSAFLMTTAQSYRHFLHFVGTRERLKELGELPRSISTMTGQFPNELEEWIEIHAGTFDLIVLDDLAAHLGSEASRQKLIQACEKLLRPGGEIFNSECKSMQDAEHRLHLSSADRN